MCSSVTTLYVLCTRFAVGASAPESVELVGELLSWQQPTDVRGVLTKYQVVFTVIGTTVVTRNTMMTFNVSSSETSANLHDFGVPTGTYQVQVSTSLPHSL